MTAAKRPAKRPTRVARSAEPRPLTDAREMRALAHPVRVALLEALTREGPLTATEAADLVGESPSNCSFHLRTLAKYGFVEEAEGGSGRARPWRRVALGISFGLVHDERDTDIAAQALATMNDERIFGMLRDWSASRGSHSKEWRDAAFTSNLITYLTADELAQVEDELYATLRRYRDRTLDRAKRPEGSAPVSLAVIGHPLPPTPSGN